METLRRVLRWVDSFTKWCGYFVAGFVIFLIVVTLYGIIARQFGIFTAWAFDVEWFTFAFIMMLAMGYAVLKGQHVKIDLATTHYSPRIQEFMMVISYSLFAIPLMVFMAVWGWDFALMSIKVQEKTLVAWAAPIWPIKLFIVIGCTIMLPQCFAELIRHTYFLIKKERL